MLDEMSSTQLIEWRRYDARHPIGELRQEIQGAHLEWLISQIVAGKENKSDVVDFMWSFADRDTRARAKHQRLASDAMRAFGVTRG